MLLHANGTMIGKRTEIANLENTNMGISNIERTGIKKCKWLHSGTARFWS